MSDTKTQPTVEQLQKQIEKLEKENESLQSANAEEQAQSKEVIDKLQSHVQKLEKENESRPNSYVIVSYNKKRYEVRAKKLRLPNSDKHDFGGEHKAEDLKSNTKLIGHLVSIKAGILHELES